ncbi:MAG: DUF411 domain-containing protein [Burkholderiales bacterium]|nr:DUF411 domain-containing protein [Burkholderiales bacterium]
MRKFLATTLLASTIAWQGSALSADNALPTVTVYKTPSCGCCEKWIQHLREAGFPVEAHDRGNLDRVRSQLGVPRSMAGCHTAQVGGYAVEGHVPAAQIQRLLAEKPEVVGISVPGMPVGSPGMEGEGGHEYRVMAWRRDGGSSVYSVEQPRAR